MINQKRATSSLAYHVPMGMCFVCVCVCVCRLLKCERQIYVYSKVLGIYKRGLSGWWMFMEHYVQYPTIYIYTNMMRISGNFL